MSTIIALPSFVWFKDADLTFSRISSAMRSKYTGKRQVLVQPYALWTFKGKLITMSQVEAAPWRSFLMQLKGQANLFRLPVPGASPVSNYAGANPLVNGASQTGNTLTVDTATPGALILADGDYFTVNDELKVCNGSCTADGGGNATITFQPSLRYSPADDATVNISAPTVLLSLTTDDVSWSLTTPVNHDIAIDGTEAYE